MKHIFVCLLLISFLVPVALSAQATSSWVFMGSDGHLHYKTDSNGNHILDYSYAGYEGGGVALPTVPVARTIDRKSTRLNSSHRNLSRMPSSA